MVIVSPAVPMFIPVPPAIVTSSVVESLPVNLILPLLTAETPYVVSAGRVTVLTFTAVIWPSADEVTLSTMAIVPSAVAVCVSVVSVLVTLS